MASEDKGEWKLVRVWECKACKLLIKDGRKVFDHTCTIKDRDDELLRLKKTIEDLNHNIEEQKIIIENKDKVIKSQNDRINGLENFIKELNDVMGDKNNDLTAKEHIIDDQKIVIEDQNKVIDNNKKTIINLEMTIEEQKKNQNKVIEKIVYLDKNSPKTDKNESIKNINVDIWQRDFRIKDSKDEGYREEIEVEIFERGKGREKVIIKNGKVVKKPEDIIVIGKNSSEGFIVKGIYRN